MDFRDDEMFGRIPLLKGEGGPKGRVRGKDLISLPLTRRPSRDGRHPLPSGEGFAQETFLFWTALGSRGRLQSGTRVRIAFINISLFTREFFFRGFFGTLFRLRNELLCILNGLVFLRVYVAFDFSSFTCVWHISTSRIFHSNAVRF